MNRVGHCLTFEPRGSALCAALLVFPQGVLPRRRFIERQTADKETDMRKVLLALMLVALAIGGVSRMRAALAQGGKDYCCECMDGSKATVHADSFATASSECSVACAGSDSIRKVTEGKCS
jgi:hypothetical protein